MSDPEPVPPSEGPLIIDLDGLTLLEHELGDVERALQRLDEGTYGTCEACGAALADQVLEAEPAARLCPAHSASG